MKTAHKLSLILLTVGAMLSGGRVWSSTPLFQGFTYQGRFLAPDGGEPMSDVIDLVVGIYSPDGNCLLYEERHTSIDLSQTAGFFSVHVGSEVGSPKRVAGRDPAKALSLVFSNSSQIRVPGADCASGYTPSAGDIRKLRVTVYPHGGPVETMSPDLTITPVPQATVAETLQGKTPDDFIANSGAINPANLGILTAGIGSDASDLHRHDIRYVQLGSTPSFSSLTVTGSPTNATDACTKGYADTKFGGSTLDLSTLGAGKSIQWDGAKWVAYTPATGSGTVTNVSGNAPISVSNGTTTPSISIATANGTTTGALSSADWTTFNGKENALTFSSPLTRTTNAISIPAATSVSDGYLAKEDWTAFNAKLGSEADTLATVTGRGASTATAVTFSGGASFPGNGIWNSSGNVGIGTTNPGYLLDVNGAANLGSLRIGSGELDLNGGSLTHVNSLSNSFGTSNVTTGNIFGWNATGLTSGNWMQITHSSSSFSGNGLLMKFANGSGAFTGNFIDLQNNGVSKFLVTGAGNVGIGTTNPVTQLHVAAPSPPAWVGSKPVALVESSGTSNSYFAFGVKTGAADALAVTNAGNTGFGLTAPAARVDIKGSTADNSAAALNVADSSGSSKFYIRNDGNVGIGTTSPNSPLHVHVPSQNAVREKIFRASVSDAPKHFFQIHNGTIANSVFSPMVTGAIEHSSYTPLSLSANINASSDVGDQPLMAFNARSYLDGEDPFSPSSGFIDISSRPLFDFRQGADNTSVMRITSSGNLGIGTTNPSDRLHVAGGEIRVDSCVKKSDGSAIAGVCASDIRFKRDIESLDSMLDRVTSLRPVTYHWKSEEFPERHWGEKRDMGLIAQEAEEVVPELVETRSDGYKAVAYQKIPLLILQAVKELYAKFTDDAEEKGRQLASQASEVAALKSDLRRLEAENAALKDAVCELNPTASVCR